MAFDPELVHLGVDGFAATVTLDSPDNRNALSRALVGQLRSRLDEAASSAQVRVVVLAHTGGTFCAGADLVEAVDEGMAAGTQRLLDLLVAILELPVPVVAAVHGHVRAGGVGLVGACDLAVATESSTFAFTEVRLGLAPAIISLTTRSRLPDREAARRYLTGEVFDGTAAARCGLVSQASPAAVFDEDLAEAVAGFAAASPQGLRETKRLLNAPMLAGIAADGARLVELSARLFASEDAREGMTAFRERRSPRWAL